MHMAATLLVLMALSTPAAATETGTPMARSPSEMTSAEIDAYNEGRPSTDADYIRCRRIEQVGSLVRKLRVCNTNAGWKQTIDKGNQDARDTLAIIERGHSNSQEPAEQIGPQIRPQ